MLGEVKVAWNYLGFEIDRRLGDMPNIMKSVNMGVKIEGTSSTLVFQRRLL